MATKNAELFIRRRLVRQDVRGGDKSLTNLNSAHHRVAT